MTWSAAIEHTLASDALLYGALLAASVLLVRALPLPSLPALWRAARSEFAAPGPFSLETAAHAFAGFERAALADVARMRASYGRLSWAHRRAAAALGYPDKLARLEAATRANAAVTRAIGVHSKVVLERRGGGTLGRTREALRHFVRDWSAEGAPERATIFTPILEALADVPIEERAGKRVLVPGSGLGRLAWEISELGFDTTANELSFYMNLALRFLLDPTTTPERDMHTVHPYAHWFSHQRSNDALFRPVRFPDVLPRRSATFRTLEADFYTFPDGAGTFDAVVTLFFLDTSLNAIAAVERIYSLLKPGGRWINLGPLLWTGGGEAALELSLEEVLALVRHVGFVLDEGERRTVECEYTADRSAMMRWVYQAEFWVAYKPE